MKSNTYVVDDTHNVTPESIDDLLRERVQRLATAECQDFGALSRTWLLEAVKALVVGNVAGLAGAATLWHGDPSTFVVFLCFGLGLIAGIGSLGAGSFVYAVRLRDIQVSLALDTKHRAMNHARDPLGILTYRSRARHWGEKVQLYFVMASGGGALLGLEHFLLRVHTG